MKNPKEQISSNAVMFSIACFIQGTSLLSSFVTGVTRQETWIVVVTGFILHLLILCIYVALANKFPGKDLIEINNCVFGKLLGKIFSIAYIFYFFSLSFLDSRILGDFVVGYIMPETPMVVILTMFIFTCCYAVRKGTIVMTNYSTLFVIITIGLPLFTTALLIPNMKLTNFFPMFSLPIKNYIQGTHIQATLPTAGTFLFFMMFSDVQNPQKIAKPLFIGTIIGMSSMLFFVIRDTSVIGSSVALVASPTFEVIRLINVANVFTRMEILYALILIVLLFFQISTTIYATTKATSQLFNLNSYKVLVYIIGSLTTTFALLAFKSSDEHGFWGENFSATYCTFFSVILPFITLITAAIQNFYKSKVRSQ
jgi:spore germination protein KB